MDQSRKRFWDTFEQMQEDFARFFAHYAQAKRPALLGYRARWSPPYNVYEAENTLHVLVEVAGMNREGLDLCIEADRMILRGVRAEPDLPARGHYQQLEITFGEFEVEMPLNTPVDAASAHAWYQHGFLHIVLSKIAEPKLLRVTLEVPEGV